jgi:hypothetical protein
MGICFAGNIGQAYNQKVGGNKKGNKGGIKEMLLGLKDKLEESFSIVHCVRFQNNPNHPLGRLVIQFLWACTFYLVEFF